MENFNNFSIVDGECINCSVGHFNSAFSSLNNQLLVMNFNIQCFDSKFDEFSAFLDNISSVPQILFLTKTWFSPTTCSNISGFKGYH